MMQLARALAAGGLALLAVTVISAWQQEGFSWYAADLTGILLVAVLIVARL
jgi:hypothetical protein